MYMLNLTCCHTCHPSSNSQRVDGLLASLGTRVLLVPSVKATLRVWTQHLGFTRLLPQEHEVGRRCSCMTACCQP